MSRVLVIPGGKSQYLLIKKLKNEGHEVVCIDPDINAIGMGISDYPIVGDILDKKNCVKIAKDYEVNAVISDECDIAMPVVAYLGSELNLITLSINEAELYTNKAKMRIFCKETGFLYPEFKICYTVEEALEFYKNKKFEKLIIKPLDSNSSRGVFLISNEDELKRKYIETQSFSKQDKAVLCERYIEGTEFTVDGLVLGDTHYSLAVSEKRHYEYNPNIACELFFSYKNDRFDYDYLRYINDLYVKKTGLRFGLTHAEYKYENGNYYLIEIGARGGGNYISSHIVPLFSNINSYDYLINMSLRKEFLFSSKELKFNKKRCAVLKFFDVDKEGYVSEITNLELLKSSKILKYEFRFQKGDYITKAENDSNRVGFYIAWEENEYKLREIMKMIEENVRIEIR